MDLRLDYMHPAEPYEPVYVSAKVYRNTSNVLFCRGSAWQGDPENPIAHCVATFMKVDSPDISVASALRRRLRRLVRGVGTKSNEVSR